MNKKTIIIFFGVLMCLLPLQWYCASRAFYTLGETYEGLYYLIIGLFTIIGVITAIMKRLKMSVLVLTLGYLIIVPFNLYLWQDLIDLKEESNAIIQQLRMDEEALGQYPQELTQPHDERIVYKLTEEGFQLQFHVYTRNTSYFYLSHKGWNYYPD